jgi:hypothetical protein
MFVANLAANLAAVAVASSSKASATPMSKPSPAVIPSVGAFSFVGCWAEGSGVRALSATSYESDAGMTLEACASFCSGYGYFATEFAIQCYCGDTLAASSANASLADCSMPCSGDAAEYCGGPDRLELYSLTANTTTGATDPDIITVATTSAGGGDDDEATWYFYGCVTEGNGTRALNAAANAADNMTLEACAGFCAGYKFFGCEYGRECYCGNSFGTGSVNASIDGCSMPCGGNGEELCGGGNRLSVYHN